jgi:preprotein translocase subunit SecE
VLGVRSPPDLLKTMGKGNIFRRIKAYLTDVQGELKNVTWPTKNDLYKTTIAVIICSFIFGVFLSFSDYAFHEIFEFIKDIIRKF